MTEMSDHALPDVVRTDANDERLAELCEQAEKEQQVPRDAPAAADDADGATPNYGEDDADCDDAGPDDAEAALDAAPEADGAVSDSADPRSDAGAEPSPGAGTPDDPPVAGADGDTVLTSGEEDSEEDESSSESADESGASFQYDEEDISIDLFK